jgi:hypothetical protein
VLLEVSVPGGEAVPAPFRMRISPRRLALLFVASLAITATCVDSPTGPRGKGPATFSIAPVFSQSATFAKALYSAAGLELDHVRLVITRPPSEVVKDTTVVYDGTGELLLDLSIIGPVGELLTVRLDYISGSVVLYSGTAQVTSVSPLTPPDLVPQVAVVIEPVGPGFNAASVTIDPSSGTFSTAATLAFTAKAFTSAPAEIAGALFGWSVDDETVGTIDAAGTLTPTTKGGPIKVKATALSGVFAEANVTLKSPPVSITLVSGGGQTAVTGTQLTQIVVKVADVNGNGVAGELVTFAVATGGGSVVINNGTTDASGLARVTWTLGATVGAQSITATRAGLTGSPLTVTATGTAGSASALVFSVQPSAVAAGAQISPAVQVAVKDVNGNTVSTFAGAITMAIANNGGSATLGGTLTVNAVAGIATFNDLSVNVAGSGYTLSATSTGLTAATSSAFNVTTGAATALTLSSGGGQTAATGAQLAQIAVKVADAAGNGVAGEVVTFAVVTGGGSIVVDNGTTDASGLARVTWTLGATVGAQSITATRAGLTGSPLTITANATGATKLGFTVEPTTVIAGATISPAVKVAAQDASGNTITSFTGTITLAIGTNPGSATLGGTVSAAAVAGVATFGTLTISAAANGYTLTAAATGLTSATSAAFNATPGTATALEFVVQPTNTLQNAAISPPVQVRIKNSFGATVNNATNIVTIAIGSNPGGSTLGGNPNAAAVFGIASFSTLTLDGVASGYTLTASASGLIGTTSTSFNILAPPSATRTWTGAFSTAWTDVSNWSPAGSPTVSDSVVIPSGTSFSPTISANTSIGALVVQSGAALTVGAFQLSASPGKVTNQGTLNLNGTLLLGALDNEGTTIIRGTVAFAGVITNAAGAMLRVQGANGLGAAALAGGAAITNNGTLELTSIDAGFDAVLSAGGGLTNTVTGTISALQGVGSGDRDISGAINNQGTISITTTSGVDFVQSGSSSINSGSITVTSGDLRLTQATTADAFTNTGTVTIATGRKWTVSGGTLNLAGGTTSGAGTLDLNGVTVGSFSTAAVTTLIAPDAATTFPGNLVTVPSGEQLRMVTGAMAAAVSVQSGGTYFSQGTVAQSGALTLPSGATLRVQGNPTFSTGTLTVANGFTNAGTIEMTDLGGHAATLAITTGTLTQSPTGTFTMTGTGTRTLALQLDNQGTMNVSDNLTLAKASAVHTNSGTINVTGGVFTLTQSGTTPSFTNTGTVAISAARTWNVTGGALVLTGGTTSGLGTLDLNGVVATFSTTAVTTLLNFDAATTITGNLITVGSGEQLRMVGGTVTADVTVASGGTYYSRGAVNQNGTLTVPTGGTLHLQGTPGFSTGTFTLLNGYTNDGTLQLSDSGGHAVTMAITAGALTNPAGGTFTMTGTGTRTLALQLINQGTMTLADNVTLAKASAAHTNSGTINVTGGTFTLTQSGTTPSFTNTGTVAISATRTWNVTGGSLVLTGGTTSGLGTLDLNGVVTTFSTAAVTTLLNFDAATTVVGNQITIGSAQLLRMVGGTVTADVTVASGGIYYSRGAVNQNGTLTVPTGGTLHLQGTPGFSTSTFTLLNGYTNNGTLQLSDSGGHAVSMGITSGSLTNPVGGTFTMTGTGARTLALQLDNQGTMTLADNITLAKASAVHTNSGTINVTGGVFTLTQSGTTPSFTNTGTVAISAARTWNVTGGALVLTGGTTSGLGTLDLNGVVVTFSTAAVTTLLNFDAATTVVGNSITIGSTQLLRMVGGTVTADVTVASGGIYYSRGAVNQNGTLTVPTGGTLHLQGTPGFSTSTFTLLNGYTNNGTLQLSDSGGHAVSMAITNGSLTHAAGGTFTMTGTGTRTLALQLVNQGVMTLADNLTLAKASAVHTNSGTINVTGGVFTLTQSGTTPSFTNTGTVAISATRTWNVTGGSLVLTGGTTSGLGTLDLNGVVVTFSTAAVTTLLNFDAATTVVGNSITIGSTQLLRMVGGTVTADVTVASGGIYYSRGTVNQNGTLTVPTGGTLHLQGTPGFSTSNFTLLNGYTNNGTLQLSDSGGHAVSMAITTGSLTHAAGGTFTMTGTGTRTLALELVNQGTMTLTNNLTLAKASALHTNSGTINVTGGVFTLTQSGTAPSFTNTGTVAISATRTWNVTGGSLVLTGGTTSGLGTLDLNGVVTTFSTAAVSTLLNFDAATTVVGNLITVGSAQQLRMVGGTVTADVTVASGGVYYSRGAVNQNGTLTVPTGGTLHLQGTPGFSTSTFTLLNGYTNSGTLQLSDSSGHAVTMAITTGSLTHAAGGTFTMTGSGTRTLNANLVNQGTFSPSTSLTINGQVTNQSTFTVPSSVPLTINGQLNNAGTFTIAGNQTVLISKAAAAHTNSGTISLPSITSGTLNIGATSVTQTFNNTGTVSVGAGRTLALLGITAFTNGVGGIYTGPTGGTLNVASTSSFTNTGTIEPGGIGVVGTMNYVGVWNPGASGLLKFDQGNASADQIAISGNATIGGTLTAAWIAPTNTTTYTLMSITGTRSGAFTTTNMASGCTFGATNPAVTTNCVGALQ